VKPGEGERPSSSLSSPSRAGPTAFVEKLRFLTVHGTTQTKETMSNPSREKIDLKINGTHT
jgi:hypothetical protein